MSPPYKISTPNELNSKIFQNSHVNQVFIKSFTRNAIITFLASLIFRLKRREKFNLSNYSTFFIYIALKNKSNIVL